MQCASKVNIMAGTQVSMMFSWRKLNLLHDVHTGFYVNFTCPKKQKKNRNSETGWNQNGKLQKIQDSNTSKDREIELIYKEIRKKRKEKVLKIRTWLIHNMKILLYCCWRICLVRNKKIPVYVSFKWYCCRWWMKYTINLSSINCQTTWSYLKSSFIRSIVIW